MKMIDKVALLEGIKELIRTGLIAVVPLLIVQLQTVGGLDWKTLGIAVAIAVLSAVDKWLHKKDIQTPLDLTSMNHFIR